MSTLTCEEKLDYIFNALCDSEGTPKQLVDLSELQASIDNITNTDVTSSPMYYLAQLWNALFPGIGINETLNPELAMLNKLNTISTKIDGIEINPNVNIDLDTTNEKIDNLQSDANSIKSLVGIS